MMPLSGFLLMYCSLCSVTFFHDVDDVVNYSNNKLDINAVTV